MAIERERMRERLGPRPATCEAEVTMKVDHARLRPTPRTTLPHRVARRLGLLLLAVTATGVVVSQAAADPTPTQVPGPVPPPTPSPPPVPSPSPSPVPSPGPTPLDGGR